MVLTPDDGGTGLPASIQTAWGLRERPGRGPRPGLTLARIVDAAVRVAAAEGLTAVSMSRVASDLGVATMSLYRYVATKNELLLLMEDAAYGPPPPEPQDAADWRSRLAHWAWAARAVLQRHPWVPYVPISQPPLAPHAVAWMESGLAALRGTGLREGEKISVVMLVSGFVRNEARLTTDIVAAAEASGSTVDQAMSSWARTIATLTDAERFPAVTAAFEAGVLDAADGPDDEFTFGLARILDGVEVLVRDRG